MRASVTLKKAEQRLEVAGIRMTAQRRLITEYLFVRLSHPSAEQLYEAIYADYPKVVSITTIYNNMRVLRDLGLVKEFYIHHSGTTRYDTNVRPHHHLYCVQCGSIDDYTESAPLQGRIGPGFQASGAYVEISGTCQSCSYASKLPYHVGYPKEEWRCKNKLQRYSIVKSPTGPSFT
ncbi:Fur family transcriptional regulator [Paenibacillus puerhi]|uniref:Fur family transcriptional regulator n=1 Tax=Paenibacillus puerhi TaxID=2692622 RepID=UPI0013572CC3|nr:Fur family transcriptional regulator [Paenibacillus puerhi]